MKKAPEQRGRALDKEDAAEDVEEEPSHTAAAEEDGAAEGEPEELPARGHRAYRSWISHADNRS